MADLPVLPEESWISLWGSLSNLILLFQLRDETISIERRLILSLVGVYNSRYEEDFYLP